MLPRVRVLRDGDARRHEALLRDPRSVLFDRRRVLDRFRRRVRRGIKRFPRGDGSGGAGDDRGISGACGDVCVLLRVLPALGGNETRILK